MSAAGPGAPTTSPSEGIRWRRFGGEVFAEARRLNRPLLVKVGAHWCHWCHLMERTTYAHPEVVRLVKAEFVAVEVDRDRQPAVDRRLQQSVAAHQMALTGRAVGGWPLTAFLTPEGALIHGETYIEPNRFLRLASAVAQAYRRHRPEIERREALMERILVERRSTTGPRRTPPRGLIREVLEALRGEFDADWGGFGAGPKFPTPSAFTLLMHPDLQGDTRSAMGMALKSLTAIARGGIRDHVGGGFHRYCVDRRWLLPHFEKVLEVNAGLLDNYLDLYRLTGSPLAREAAEEVIRFLDRTLSDRQQGGFYASQGADVPGGGTTYFTWTREELEGALPEDVRREALSYFALSFPAGGGRGVLYARRTLEEAASRCGVSVERMGEVLRRSLEALRTARGRRTPPPVDRTVFVDWNAAAIRAYLKAGVVLGREDCRDFALASLERLIAQAHHPDLGMAHYLDPGDGEPRGFGHLSDNIAFAAALLDAYEQTGRRRYLEMARDLVDLLLETLWDEEGAGFFDRLVPEEEAVGLFARPQKPIQDTLLPAENALAAETLLRLGVMTGRGEYRLRAEEALGAFAHLARHLGPAGAGLVLAVDRLVGGGLHLVVVGPPARDETLALHRVALRTDHPRRTVQLLLVPRDRDLVEALGLFEPNEPALFVCGEGFRLEPILAPEELPGRLAEFEGRMRG